MEREDALSVTLSKHLSYLLVKSIWTELTTEFLISTTMWFKCIHTHQWPQKHILILRIKGKKMHLQIHYIDLSLHILLNLCIVGCLFCIFVLYMDSFFLMWQLNHIFKSIVTDKRNDFLENCNVKFGGSFRQFYWW
jgi:hypothetical protein